MEILSKDSFLKNKEFYLSEILGGKIFIYPTDTIYGIGCNALNGMAVDKIREIKRRDSKPFSVIVPSKEWIKKNCVIGRETKDYLSKLPGPYTFIMKLSKRIAVSQSVVLGKDTIGVRIPFNWFAEIIVEAELPFVTTSVNVSGMTHAKRIEEIDKEILDRVDYVIDDGELLSSPSTIVDFTSGNEPRIIKRG